jgi:hypothetical protein
VRAISVSPSQPEMEELPGSALPLEQMSAEEITRPKLAMTEQRPLALREMDACDHLVEKRRLEALRW